MSNPFDVVNDISYKKERLVHDEVTEKLHAPFLVNRAFSYFPDTIQYAQEMNLNAHIDRKMQHDYLFNSIRKKKRFSKHFKKQLSSDVEIVQEYYQYSNDKAKQAVKVLTEEQIQEIRKRLEKGE